MYQIIETTHEEKVRMYNKLSKKDLITMLIEANRHLNSRPYEVYYEKNDFMKPPYTITCSQSGCSNYFQDPKSTGMLCLHCGCGKYGHK